MSLQNQRVFSVSWPTGATFSNPIDLAGGFLYVAIEVPSSLGSIFSAATPVYVQGSADDTNFRRYMEPLTATVSNDYSIASSVSNRICVIPYFGSRYIRLECSGTVTTPASGASGFRVICTDSL